MKPAPWITSLALLSCNVGHAQKVETPAIDPVGGGQVAPVAVTFRCATPGAVIHVTTDGTEPTERDLELEPGATILLDTPSTVKARASMRDGRASGVASALFNLQPVAGDGASFLEQDVPSIVATGRSYRVTVSFRNIGTTQWTAATHRLDVAKANAKWGWVAEAVTPSAPVEQWRDADFDFPITAPAKPGTYNFEWRMGTAAGGTFGEVSPVKRIVVIDSDADPDGVGVPNWLEVELGTKFDSADSDRNGIPDGAEDHDGDGTPDATEYLARSKAAVTPATIQPKLSDAEAATKLLEVLKSGPRSYKQLRAMGFAYSDAEFDALLKKHTSLFLSTTSAHPGDAARPVVPGSTSLMLNLSPSLAQIDEPYVRALLVKALKNSGHSYKHLRTVGYNYSDADFEALIKANPDLFRYTRIVRRDESGKRVIPGWPAITLKAKKEEKK